MRLAAAVLAATLLATACGSSSERQTISSPSTVKCVLQIEIKNPAFAPSGGSGMLNISVDRECAWTAKSDATWVTLSAAEGQGNGSVPFTVASNADPSERTANIVANDQRLQITQQGKACELSLSSNRDAVDAAGGDRTVDVRASSSQCSWTASANVPWIDVTSGSEGRGNGVVRFRIDPTTGPPRSGTLTIAGQTVHVDQGTGCGYSIGTDTFTVDPSGGERQVAVTAPAGCAWTAASNTAWITITRGSTGAGAGLVNFRVDATAGPARSGTLTIAGQRVHVDQGTGCSNSMGSETFNVDPSGGERQLAVTAPPGCAWTAVSNTAWITITGGSTGTGAGLVNFRVDATAGPARSGTLTVAGRTVTVVQSTGCNISVSPASFDQSAGGGNVTIAVEAGAGCAWSAATDVAWVTIAGAANGSGRGQVQAAVAANAGPARTGFVIVNGQRVAIRQATGCAYAVSPAAQQIAAGGGPAAGSISTAPGCTWSATSALTWITIATPSGSGPGQATFTVAPNDGPRRAGTLTIAGQVLTVNQSSNCTWSFAPPSYDFDAAGGSSNVLVFVAGACTWTGTSTVDWIRVTNIGVVVGGGVLQFSVAPNGGPARTGTIVIAGENYQVRQAGR